jgi:two-component system chemotaxis response regulator CheY
MKTVMVVDDSQIMRRIVKSTFSQLNIPCQYVEAPNGEEALLRLREQQIDLILLDWNMPRLSGIDFLKKVRSIERYKDLPIIMVTSEAARLNVVEALSSGATDYIVKPVNEKIFLEKLSRIAI